MRSHSTLFIAVMLAAFPFAARGQAATQQVISAAGGSDAAGPVHVSWTLGETAVDRMAGPFRVTEGFHQPMLRVEAGWPDKPGVISTQAHDDALQRALTVYPNPASDRVEIRRDAGHGEPLAMRLYDAEGRAVWTGQLESGATHMQVLVDHLVAGAYYLIASGPASARGAQFTITKIK
jgi:hypothetical protein